MMKLNSGIAVNFDRDSLFDELLDRAIEAIQATACTQKLGDGKIFVVNLEAAIRIRTGEVDDAAI